MRGATRHPGARLDPRAFRSCYRAAAAACLLLATLAWGTTARAQDNQCDPGESPDVIVGDIDATRKWGVVGDVTAFSIATWSCNVGSCWLNWIDDPSNQHPGIGQNMFRLKDGRYEQIGQSWLKHGFNALSLELCSVGCRPTFGTHLGVNCADPYSAGLNGDQTGLGPKFEVHAAAGSHPHPYTDQGTIGDAIYKRLQIHNDDLDPALNTGALYFVEGHYIAQDDAMAMNDDNNASYREILVSGSDGNFDIEVTDVTVREEPGISAWAANDAGVDQVSADVAIDGRFIVAAKATDLGGGVWHYEYAIQNYNSHRSAGSFSVPIPFESTPTNVGFHDVDYHSGEPFDGTDWSSQTNPTEIVWATDSFDVNQDANALRWGTLYNFRFDLDVPPVTGDVTLGLFRPGDPTEVLLTIVVPSLCDDDGLCDPGESCGNCLNDCPDTGPDDDGDMFNLCVDCDDANPGIWATPGEVRNLRFTDPETLSWDPPLNPGSTVVQYETLRSGDPADFLTNITCLTAPNPEDTSVMDPDDPFVGAQFNYLPRATNACSDGEGSLGNDSAGTPREGASCP